MASRQGRSAVNLGRHFVFVLAIGLGMAGLLAIVAMVQPAAKPPSLVVGVSTHVFGRPQVAKRSLDAMKQLGVTSLRVDAQWKYVERIRGLLSIPAHWDSLVDAANERQIRPLLILDYGNKAYDNGGKPTSAGAVGGFVRYAQTVAEHFKGRVFGYEVWNEWDGTAGNTTPGSAAAYVRLLEATYPVIKAADSNAIVLGGAVTSRGIKGRFLGELLQAGGLNHMDALSLHPYVQCNANPSVAAWRAWLARVEKRMTSLTHQEVPIYVTEIGWPSSLGRCGCDERTQAERAHEVVIAAQNLAFIGGIWWYDLQDDGRNPFDPQDRFGLLREDMTPKPAFGAFRQAIQQVAGL